MKRAHFLCLGCANVGLYQNGGCDEQRNEHIDTYRCACSSIAGAEREGMKKQISEMQQFLAEQQQDITEYDEQLVRRLIEKITVYDERVTVEF